jgi:hypothetical protein
LLVRVTSATATPSPATLAASPGLTPSRLASARLVVKTSPRIRLRSGLWLSGGNTGNGWWTKRKLG